jgi:hypothetical protein
MASKLNSEFNYRYQVIGDTPWEKIKQLQNFLVGRERAAALEKVSELKLRAKYSELETLRSNNAMPHLILNLEAELIELESVQDDLRANFELNQQEIKILKKLLAELYEVVEPTRLRHEDGTPYSDEEMFEVNAVNEFTVMIGKEIQAEIIANGRPSPAKLKNAMSNPYTFLALQQVGLLPKEAVLLEGNADPLKIELRQSPAMLPVSPDDNSVNISLEKK